MTIIYRCVVRIKLEIDVRKRITLTLSRERTLPVWCPGFENFQVQKRELSVKHQKQMIYACLAAFQTYRKSSDSTLKFSILFSLIFIFTTIFFSIFTYVLLFLHILPIFTYFYLFFTYCLPISTYSHLFSLIFISFALFFLMLTHQYPVISFFCLSLYQVFQSESRTALHAGDLFDIQASSLSRPNKNTNKKRMFWSHTNHP